MMEDVFVVHYHNGDTDTMNLVCAKCHTIMERVMKGYIDIRYKTYMCPVCNHYVSSEKEYPLKVKITGSLCRDYND